MGSGSIDRRRVLTGMLTFAGGSLFASSAAALTRGAALSFRAATRLLEPFGITISGDTSRGHDSIDTQILPLADTEYTQSVVARDAAGGVSPSIETSVFGDDASFTHFHPGEIIPCIKTAVVRNAVGIHDLFDPEQGGIVPCFRVESEMLDGGHIGTITATHFHATRAGEIVPCVKTLIDGHELAVHELFDAEQGGIVPCVRVESEMLEGALIGAVEISVNDPDQDLAVFVGGRTYRLRAGELVEETPPR